MVSSGQLMPFKTAERPAALQFSTDRTIVSPDGKDLSFITVRIVDSKGALVPGANNTIRFEISGPGEIVATDNGDPADLVAFPSKERKAFNGLALVIIRGKLRKPGIITVKAHAEGLTPVTIVIKSQ